MACGDQGSSGVPIDQSGYALSNQATSIPTFTGSDQSDSDISSAYASYNSVNRFSDQNISDDDDFDLDDDDSDKLFKEEEEDDDDDDDDDD
eukprot:CAMPEP_0201493766 /NCGR_PEP_ID=MMETSP0151_2-20130828/41575_1 /ASSEMBLY_ACC=CAM_ASM_000257 /TAXON_ID=200890 /ORGANISM="Paramoeba atlantica, Strain 621/1 / CCAP 1560/9" /LENGTH=90 /DNA_ID=CAMNT_0047881457 /DNA_START=123 /DNA_END=392 /DNA_ORIENTATION=-